MTFIVQDKFDGHAHVYPKPGIEYPIFEPLDEIAVRFPELTAEQLLEAADHCGVRKVNVIKKRQFDNEYLLDVVARFPERLVATAVLDPANDNVGHQMVDLSRRGVCAFRISPEITRSHPSKWLEPPGCDEMFRIAADRELCLSCLIDPSGFSEVARMSRKYPRTRVIIDHIGKIGATSPINDASLLELVQLAQIESIYVKLSGFYLAGAPPYTNLLPAASTVVRAYGAERCLFGSDSPYQMKAPHSYQGAIDFVSGIDGLTQEQAEWIFRRTAEHLFWREK